MTKITFKFELLNESLITYKYGNQTIVLWLPGVKYDTIFFVANII